MRILYLDLNLEYANPTRNLIPRMLDYKFEVTYFGPGYVSNEVFDEGIVNFIKDKKAFDFIITNEKIALFYGCTEKTCFGSHHYVFKMDYKLFIDGMYHMKDYFYSYKKEEKIVFLMETDYYAITDEYHISAFEKLDCFFVGFGSQFIEYIENLKNLKNEKFGDKANNKWKNFVEKNDAKIISFPGIIGENEFSYNDWTHKKEICEVPGTEYYLRGEVSKVLKGTKYKAPYKIYNKIYSILKRIGIPVYGNKISLKLYNLLFSNRIETSKYSYTCGSGLDWPIRKFFEIPALGSILICNPFSSFSDLGFKDGVNCKISNPNSILDTIEYLSNNQNKSVEIARCGRELILKKHSTLARANQFFDAVNNIKKNNFFGTYWKDGEFFIKEIKKYE